MGKIIIYMCDKCKIKEEIVYPDLTGDNMPEGWFKKRSWDQKEEEWIGYMGDHSYIYVDGARIRDILNIDELSCYGFVDIDEQAYASESWNGSTFVKHPDFENLYKQKLNEYKDCFLTVLDIHD